MVEDPFSGPRRRRDRLSIIAKVLDVARRGSIKTRIMYGASLGFAQVNDYISFLLDVNLLRTIENSEKHIIYKTTSKGLRYLQCYIKIGELLKKENNPNENR